MDAQLKQRVVGAAVLVALFVIFVPIFLDDSTTVPLDPGPPIDDLERPQDFSSRVVPLDDAAMAEIERSIDAAPDELVRHDSLAPPTIVSPTADTVDESQVTSDPVEAPAEHRTSTVSPDPQRTGVTAWVVQLGSFTTQANAVALVEKLKTDGYAAFIEALDEKSKVSYRVRVGPELSQEAATQIRDELMKKIKMKGIVMRYP